ncbi:MAG: MATE family efflux transporter [Bacteroidales bacterium]|nr:MATE family efflux transporter [Bacteroidales bacterium]
MAEQIESRVEKELGQMPIGRLLLLYSLPAIIATVASSIYNLVDRIFIGQVVGALALSGLTITLPLMNIATAFGTLIGSGAATIISIRMGENRKEDAMRTLANALLLNLIIGVVISCVGLYFLDDILILLGASNATLPYARTFMQIIFLGNPLSQLFFSLNTIMRASGYPTKAMLSVLLTMVVNVILVYVLIYRLHFGIEGAAIATVAGQLVGLLWVVIHFCKEDSHLYFTSSAFNLQWGIAKHIFSIGLAPFFIHICSCFVVAIMNWQLRNFGGDYAIGAFGIISTVVNLLTVTVLGLAQGMQPIVGYNYGAKQFSRVFRALWITIGIGSCITIVGFVVMQMFPFQIAYLFSDDLVMVTLIRDGMKVYTFMFSLIGFQVVVSNFFQSIGKPKLSIFLSLSRQVLFLIPLIVLLPMFWGLQGVWIAMPIADLLATIVTAILLIYYYNKVISEPIKKEFDYENITTYQSDFIE